MQSNGENLRLLATNTALNGTTLRVYRYLFRQAGKPVGVHDVQSGLGLSSPSVAHYHIRKLVEDGLAREGAGGYVVDKMLFENMIRIRNYIIPFQTTYLVFFLSSLFMMLTIFRAPVISSEYSFALFVNTIAVCLFLWETMKSTRQR